jgi:hypothetical protein
MEPPNDSLPVCPACGAVAQIVRGEQETVHDDDCEWFHDRERHDYA